MDVEGSIRHLSISRLHCFCLRDLNNRTYRRYSSISRGFFQKNLTDKMNSTYRRVNKKNQAVIDKFMSDKYIFV